MAQSMKGSWTDKDEAALQRLRKDIDRIDDQLIELLAQRNEIVREVGAIKEGKGGQKSIIRPGREADMIRRITEKGGNGYSSAALALMWRLIISSAINIEENPHVSSYSPPGNRECYWLSREYFGAFTPMNEVPTTAEVLRNVTTRKSTVGVMPLQDPEPSQPWWSRLSEEKNPPSVFARLPFIQMAPSTKPILVAIGYVDPEPTTSDESLWIVKTPESVIFSWLEPILKRHGVSYEILGNCRKLQVTTYVHYLLRMPGFVDTNDKAMQAFLRDANQQYGSATASIATHFVGAYATPILFDVQAK